ncbi:MAG TPA: 6-phosphogluconolactonase [Paludibacter sp.]|nr:6-phosphogluconolactonase [Paludibacter sp.]
MNPLLHIHETPEDTARALAGLILVKANEKKRLSLPLNVALSGGNTPRLLFTILVQEYSETMPWHILRLFWVDERCVPPTHPESNFGMAYENLLKRVPLQGEHAFMIQGDAQPEDEVLRYQNLLETELPTHEGFPQFDLVLLGIGNDGHTASIFPGNLRLFHSEMAVVVGIQPGTGQKRITLTGSTINQASQVVFFVTGASKSSVLRQIIENEPGSEKYPAAHVRPVSGTAEFFMDKAAASELKLTK